MANIFTGENEMGTHDSPVALIRVARLLLFLIETEIRESFFNELLVLDTAVVLGIVFDRYSLPND